MKIKKGCLKFKRRVVMQKFTNSNLKISAFNEREDKEMVIDFLSTALKDIKSISPVSGGLVHSVFRVETNSEIAYLKIRGNRFTGIPDIVCDPMDLRHEAKSLRLLSKILPDNFPRYIAFNQKHALLLMTSVMTEDENLTKYFKEDRLTTKTIYNIGQTISRMHDLTCSCILNPIRDDGDEKFYHDNLQYRLRFYGNSVLNEVADELVSLPRQIIFGDLSPKNIGVCGDKITFCDLDSVHFGNVEFDIGFFAGHILLHSFQSSLQLIDLLNYFFKGYQMLRYDLETNNPLLMRIALGACLYRLDNAIVPYPLRMKSQAKIELIKNILDLLKINPLTWEDIFAVFAYAKQSS